MVAKNRRKKKNKSSSEANDDEVFQSQSTSKGLEGGCSAGSASISVTGKRSAKHRGTPGAPVLTHTRLGDANIPEKEAYQRSVATARLTTPRCRKSIPGDQGTSEETG